MGAEKGTERGDFESPEVESASEGRRRVSALLFSKPIIAALNIGHIQWAIRHLAEVERQFAGQGMSLDFDHCPELVSVVRIAYCSCLADGLESQAQALERSFEKYVDLNGMGDQ